MNFHYMARSIKLGFHEAVGDTLALLVQTTKQWVDIPFILIVKLKVYILRHL